MAPVRRHRLTVLFHRLDLAVGGVFGLCASKHLIAFPLDLHGAVVDKLAPAFTYRTGDPPQMPQRVLTIHAGITKAKR